MSGSGASTAEFEEERQTLLRYVTAARLAIAEMRPTEMRLRRLPSAMNEMGMIVETTESAANQIMAATVDIMNIPEGTSAEDYRAAVHDRCLSVMEACAFQDLTGQRITKVVTTLLTLEDRLGRLAALLGEDAAAEECVEDAEDASGFLNGPAMPGEGVDQDEIDRLFG